MNESLFLDEIRAHPYNMELRMVYADWLEERGDERAEFLRLEEQIDSRADDPNHRRAEARLRSVAGNCSAEWLAVVCRRYDVVLHQFGNWKLTLIKGARHVLGGSLRDTKQLVEAAPTKLLRERSRLELFEFFDVLQRDFKRFRFQGRPLLTIHAAPYSFDESAIERMEREAQRMLRSLRVFVTGDRDFADRELLFGELDRVHAAGPITSLILGDARGAERLSGEWAAARRVPVLREACDDLVAVERLNRLLDRKPDLIIACPGGSDTDNLMDLAFNAGIEVHRLQRPKRQGLVIGFVGTRSGMTDEQKESVRKSLASFSNVASTHHGDGVGGDQEFHEMSVRAGVPVHMHPPDEDNTRAFCEGGVARCYRARPSLARNRDIVNATGLLIAAPSSEAEESSSETWATVRYARKQGKWIWIVLPGGKVVMEEH